MSNLRERAREIKAAGEAERGDFTPTGFPLAVYKYWAARSKNAPERENFCHFWRVVAVWAPLMWAKRAAEKTFINKYSFGLLIAALVTTLIYFATTVASVLAYTLLTIAVTAGLFLAGFGIICGVSLALEPLTRTRVDLPENKFTIAAGMLLAAPVAVPTYAVVRGGRAIDDYLADWVVEHIETIGKVLLVLFGLAFVGVLFVTEGLAGLAMVAGITVAILAFAGAVVFGFSKLSDYLRGKRKLRADKSAQEERARWDFEWEYLKEHGEYPPRPVKTPKPPGKVAKFFTALADLVIFASQVARVNKWKICPTVTIENDYEHAA